MIITPLQRFFSTLEESSKPTYKIYLDKFFNHAKISHDEFCSYDRKDQEDLFENYLFYLRGVTEKTGKYQNSYNTLFAPLKHFCIMNDIAINWARIYKMFYKPGKLSGWEAYTDDDLKQFLDHCDNLRDLAFVHFMNSTAVRVGEMYLLNIRDVTPIEDGAIVKYYAGQKAEYKVCLTPEAYEYLKKYLATRKNTRPHDPLFTSKKGIIERRLAKSTLSELMKELRYKVNPNQIRDGKRKNKAPNNAFRKRLENIFADVEMHHKYTSYLLDHNKDKQDPHYFRDISNERLYVKFKKAVPLIMLDKSRQIIVSKDDEIEKLRQSYEGEFKEKIEFLESRLNNMETERARKVIEFYDDLAEKKGVKDIEEIKTKLDDVQIDEIVKARAIVDAEPLEITPSQDMLRRRYLISKQESIIFDLKKELEELAKKVPKRKSPDKMTDKQFDSLEDYEDKILEIELVVEFLNELKKRK